MNMDTLSPTDRIPLSLPSVFSRMNLDPTESHVVKSFEKVSIHRQVLQDFRPISESIEWELSEFAWDDLGVLPFAENVVPFIITNSGRLSEHAATLLFQWCQNSPPTDQYSVLEIGAGTGLFARLFLDSFKALCEEHKATHYERLLYIVSDRSQRSIDQWLERGIFNEHKDHVQTIVLDTSTSFDLAAQQLPLVAVFANYVLDVLPSTIIRQGQSGIEELLVRTHLVTDTAVIAQHTDLTYEEIHALANSQEPEQRRRLLPLSTLFEFETVYRSVTESASPPYAKKIISYQQDSKNIVLNYGALSCIENCLNLLSDNGFMLINDYGTTETDHINKGHASQRYGPTVALGINFPLLSSYFGDSDWNVVVPDMDAEAPLHARLIAHRSTKWIEELFNSRFGQEGYEYYEAPLIEAREHARAGRKDNALDTYRMALSHNRRDWFSTGEIAEYVGLKLGEYAVGLELAQEAIKLNPWYSAWLWNVMGDCLFCLDRFADAQEAYLQAYRIDPHDSRTNLNLAFIYSQSLHFEEALCAIARGLAHDQSALYREQLLEKQRLILSQLSTRSLGEQERLLQRISTQ